MVTRRFRSPGRVNVIGEHTDYNDGFVLPMAIDLCIDLVAEPSAENAVTVISLEAGERVAFSAGAVVAPAELSWRSYVAGALLALEEAGVRIPPATVDVRSSLPIGAGLSSSAAFIVGLIFALCCLDGNPVDRTWLATTARRAEELGTGARTGIMDQFTIAHGREGRAILLDCRSLEATYVPIPAGAGFLVLDSGVRHSVAGSAYNERRHQCERAASLLGIASLRDASIESVERLNEPERSRAAHVVEENARVLLAAEALAEGDLRRVGELMCESHRSLRHLYEVSIPELDRLVDFATAVPGVYGARMTGAGFGGCVVALIDHNDASSIVHRITRSYRNAVGRELRFWKVRPSTGVSEI